MHTDGFLIVEVEVEDERLPVADVAVPEGSRALGLPPQPLSPVVADAKGAAIEAAGREQASDGRRRDRVVVDAAVEHQSVEDQLGRGARMLATDLADELLLLGGERASGPPVGARRGAERRQAPPLVQPVPSRERRHGEGPRRGRSGWPEPLLAERLEASGKLASWQVEAREHPHHFTAK